MENTYDELIELTKKFTKDDYHEIVNWILSYKYSSKKEDTILNVKERIIELHNEARLSKQKEYWIKRKKQDDYYEKYLKPCLDNIEQKIIEDALKSYDKFELENAFNKITSAIINQSVYEKERDKLITDTEYLLHEIIEIMQKEYSKRIIDTKKALIDYIEPHKLAMDNLEKNKKRAIEGIHNIDNDNEIDEKDKSVIKKTLKIKLDEIIELEVKERKNIENTNLFISEIKRATNEFNYLLKYLEEKYNSIKKRKTYVSLISELGANIPELNNIFEELSVKFKQDIEKIDNAIFLLGLSLNKKIIESIENQNQTISILGYSSQNMMKNDKYDENLDFLDIINTNGA